MTTVAQQAAGVARTVWQLDPAHTTVEFSVRHMMVARVRGRFTAVRGTVELDEQDVTRSVVEVAIDASTIDTGQPQRDAHLRSPDFLDVEHHPEIRFRSRRIEPLGEGRYRVVGDLTIRGVAREVALEVEETGRTRDPWGNDRIGYVARTAINRHDWGVSWNQLLEAGGVVVGDEVKIEIEGELMRAAAQQAA